jgi:hypothetical protein
MYYVVVHFGFTLEVAIYHFANWRCSVWVDQDLKLELGRWKREREKEDGNFMLLKNRDCKLPGNRKVLILCP